MTVQQPTPSGNFFVRVIVGFFRLLFIVIVGLLLGAALYFGVPWAYRNLVLPVQDNITHVALLEDRMDREQERLQEENLALQERITALETKITRLREEADVHVQDQQALKERDQQLEEQIAQVESDLEAQQQSMEGARTELEDTRSELEDAIAGLSQQTEDTQAQLQNYLDETEGQAAGVYGQLDDLEGRLMLFQTAQDLLQVRLLLLEENPRAAREAVGLAVSHLERAIALMPAQAETLDGLRERIVALDALIAANSFRVRPNLEALWADVMDLAAPLPSRLPAASVSPVPTPTATP
jgi:chromosome segregation ATPase